MSDDSEAEKSQEDVVSVLFNNDLADIVESEEPSISEWSSLLYEKPIENVKRRLFSEGLYDPGSGEICTKYITVSGSNLFVHPFITYPACKDNGIDDGYIDVEDQEEESEDVILDCKEIYLNACKEMYVVPCNMFLRRLDQSEIDLKYYGLNPINVRAMCIALEKNKCVTTLKLTENWLDIDACYHLGRLLTTNTTLTTLGLSGCRIGVGGVKSLCDQLPINRTLKELDLSRNRLGDRGIDVFAEKLSENSSIERIYLNNNEINTNGAVSLANAFLYHDVITHLDLSWNELFTSSSVSMLLYRLADCCLVELNLSWNGMFGDRIASQISRIISNCSTLVQLNLSNNRLRDSAIDIIAGNLSKAKSLKIFDLSSNPMTLEDALVVLGKLKLRRVKITSLLMDNVWIDNRFLILKEVILRMKFRQGTIVTHGQKVKDYKIKGPDMRRLLLVRTKFLCESRKKNKCDIGMFFLALYKSRGSEPLFAADLLEIIELEDLPIPTDMVSELEDAFPGKRVKKNRTIDLPAIVEYIKRLWPSTRLPPTPLPTPPPLEPVPEPPKPEKGKKKKGK